MTKEKIIDYNKGDLKRINSVPLSSKEKETCRIYAIEKIISGKANFRECMKRAGYTSRDSLAKWEEKFRDPRVQFEIEKIINQNKFFRDDFDKRAAEKKLFSYVMGAIDTLRELSKNSKSDHVRKDAAIEILDRTGMSVNTVKRKKIIEEETKEGSLEDEVTRRKRLIEESSN